MRAYTGNIDKDLKMVSPRAIAFGITSNREKWQRLVDKARTTYAENPDWGRRITDTERGRDTLYFSMLHWFQSWEEK